MYSEKDLTFKKIDFDNPDNVKSFIEIYNSSFPIEEREPLESFKTGKFKDARCLFIYHKKEICGIIILIDTQKMLYLFFFAIKENLRDKGIGSLVLTKLKRNEKRFIALSAEYSQDKNATQIQRRFDFYKRNGFDVTNLNYLWNGVRLVLVKYGNVDYSTYKNEVEDIFIFTDYSC